MYVESQVAQWAKALAANTTQNGLGTALPTITKPVTTTSRLAIDQRTKPVGYSNLRLLFFGRNANNLTMQTRVIGWSLVGDTGTLWMPTLIAQITATLSSTLVGVAGNDVADTDMLADTISVDNGIGTVVAPVGDTVPAYLNVATAGHQIVTVDFSINGSATQANGLFRQE